MKAPEYLHKAASIMEERGKQYDSAEGERSMAQTITAFNAITGRSMTEPEGWLLMALLKMVRDQKKENGHQDSCLDLISYASLYAESRLK